MTGFHVMHGELPMCDGDDREDKRDEYARDGNGAGHSGVFRRFTDDKPRDDQHHEHVPTRRSSDDRRHP